jgi:2-polyprenyl-3-methyl-5-hydroxy-6-metoxy-1,4-benzoquinol methylase
VEKRNRSLEETQINGKVEPWKSKVEAQILTDPGPFNYNQLLSRVVKAYDSGMIRNYCKIRFSIININILHILALCLRGKRKILDVGCGFGLFGCYFSALYPEIVYCGYDNNANRINMAKQAASRLGLSNTSFHCLDGRNLSLDDQYDAIMTIDLLHHIDDESKRVFLKTCAENLADDGRLIIKDVDTQPRFELCFTWLLDVIMTRGFEMWYWSVEKFYAELGEHFGRVDTFPIADWLPYPHVVYLCENVRQGGSVPRVAVGSSERGDIVRASRIDIVK